MSRRQHASASAAAVKKEDQDQEDQADEEENEEEPEKAQNEEEDEDRDPLYPPLDYSKIFHRNVTDDDLELAALAAERAKNNHRKAKADFKGEDGKAAKVMSSCCGLFGCPCGHVKTGPATAVALKAIAKESICERRNVDKVDAEIETLVSPVLSAILIKSAIELFLLISTYELKGGNLKFQQQFTNKQNSRLWTHLNMGLSIQPV